MTKIALPNPLLARYVQRQLTRFGCLAASSPTFRSDFKLLVTFVAPEESDTRSALLEPLRSISYRTLPEHR